MPNSQLMPGNNPGAMGFFTVGREGIAYPRVALSSEGTVCVGDGTSWPATPLTTADDLAATGAALTALSATVATLSSSTAAAIASTNANVATLNNSVTALSSSVTSLGTRVTALEGRRIEIRAAQVSLPALVVGSTDVTVSWTGAMPDTNYTALLSLTGGVSILGKLVPSLKAGTKASTSFTATLTNTGLVTIGAGAVLEALIYEPLP